MRTPESDRAAALFCGAPGDVGAPAADFGILGLARRAVAEKSTPRPLDLLDESHGLMVFALRSSAVAEVAPIGRGIHRPYRVTFHSGLTRGPVTTRVAALKTVFCQFENKRYCESVDLAVTGPEREILSYALDRAIGFGLVPPTVGREVDGIGFGSVQAWVEQPTAWQWIARGYDYRKDLGNPWLHRLAAFDFIRGEIDRHSNNWIMDEDRRVYAIDNGYALVKGDDRKWFRTSAGKALRKCPVHPEVRGEVRRIDEEAVLDLLRQGRFAHGEPEGVVKRIRELKELRAWTKLGDLW